MASKAQTFIGQPQGATLGLLVHPLAISATDRNNSFYLKFCHSLCLGSELMCISLPKSRGFNKGQMLANSQCLLKMSAGLDFPFFQLNWRHPTAIGSLTL